MSQEEIRDVLSRASKRRTTVRVRVGGEQEVLGSVAWVGLGVVLLIPNGAARPMQVLLRAVEHAEVVAR